jgi:hypothetical protein
VLIDRRKNGLGRARNASRGRFDLKSMRTYITTNKSTFNLHSNAPKKQQIQEGVRSESASLKRLCATRNITHERYDTMNQESKVLDE